MAHVSGSGSGENARLAPVTPLFERSPSARHPAHRAQPIPPAEPVRLRALAPVEDVDAHDVDAEDRGGAEPDTVAPQELRTAEELRAAAEDALLRKLRRKALSVSEARLILRGEDLDGAEAEDIIDDCIRRGYLDDRVLAELLVRAGVERRAQGRAALARSLAQRGLDREVIDEALAELPDDDAERALEYARTKARAMTRLDPDTAVRRLVGQLARRGFGGSVAMQAAKQALREASRPPVTGVRFRESD